MLICKPFLHPLLAILDWEAPGVYRGVGTHRALYDSKSVENFFKSLFVCETLYTLTLCCTKFSILLFYWRIFGKTNIRIPAIILASIVTGWGLSVVSRGFPPLDNNWEESSRWLPLFFIAIQFKAFGTIRSQRAAMSMFTPFYWKCCSKYHHRLGAINSSHTFRLAPSTKPDSKDRVVRRIFAWWIVRQRLSHRRKERELIWTL